MPDLKFASDKLANHVVKRRDYASVYWIAIAGILLQVDDMVLRNEGMPEGGVR